MTLAEFMYKIGFDVDSSKADSAVDSFVNSTTSKLDKLSSTMSSAGTKLTAGVTAPLVAAGTAATMTAANFEAGMSQVQATMGITKEATTELSAASLEYVGGLEQMADGSVNTVDALSALAKKLGAETAFSATEAADAINIFAMAGKSTDEIYSMLPKTLSLASAGGMDIASAADIVTGVMAGFNMEGTQTQEVTDKIAMMASSAKGSVSDFGTAMSVAAGQASITGQSFDTTATALMILGNHNVSASEGGMMLQRVMKNLYQPTDTAAKAFKKLGVDAFDKVTGEARPMQEVLQDLNTAMDGLSDQAKNDTMSQLFDTAALRGANFLISESGEQWDNLASAIDGAGDAYGGLGAAEGQAQAQLDNLKGKITIFKSHLEAVAITIGDMIIPVVEQVIAKADSVLTFFESLGPENQKMIVTLAGIAAAIGPVLLGGSKVVSVLSKVIGVVGALPGGAALLIGALVLLGGALMDLYDNNEGFQNFIDNLWQGIQNAIPRIIQGAANLLSALANAIAANLPRVVSLALQVGTQLIGSILDGIISVLPQLIQSGITVINSLVTTITDNLPGAVMTLLQMGIQLITSLLNGILSALPSLVSSATTLLSSFIQTISSGLGYLVTEGAQLVISLIQGIVAMAPQILSSAVLLITQLIQGISSNLGNILVQGANIIVTLIQGILQMLPTILASAGQIIGRLLVGLIQMLPQLIQAGVQIIVALALGIVQAIPQLLAGFKTMLDMVWEALKGIDWPQLGMDIINGIIDGLMAAGDALMGFFDDPIGSLKSMFSSGGKEAGAELASGIESSAPDAQAATKELGDLVKTDMQGALAGFGSLGGGAVGDLASSMEANSGLLDTAAFDLGSILPESMGSGITSGTGDLQGIIEGLGSMASTTLDGSITEGLPAVESSSLASGQAITENMATGIDTTLSEATSAAENASTETVGTIVDGVNEGTADITATLAAFSSSTTSTWDTIQQEVTTSSDTMNQNSVQAFNSMVDGISSACGQILGAVQSGFAPAISYIQGLASQSYQWGVDFMQGLINGINSMMGDVAAAASNAASTISSYMHFSRPDTGPLADYETWMPDFMQGLAKGINDNRDLVEGAMRSLSGDMSSGIYGDPVMPETASAASGAAQSRVINQTINYSNTFNGGERDMQQAVYSSARGAETDLTAELARALALA